MNTSTEQQTYILQKDLPYVKAGAKYKTDGFNYTCIEGGFSRGTFDTLTAHVVENNPEWFKKEEPKQWEILSVKDKYGKVWNQEMYKGQPHFCGNTYEYVLQSKIGRILEIHSVKRLSDGEVFTVGEIVVTNSGRGQHKIDGFKIIDGDMCVVMNTFLTGNEFLYAISKLPKEEPLPIKVLAIMDCSNPDISSLPIGKLFTFVLNQSIPTEKWELVKKAIESVLLGNVHEGNYETFTNGYKMGRYDASKYDQKQYTADELLKAQKEAFQAARTYYHQGVQYPTFEDYLNSLK